ncbi:MAG: ABC transporter permease, partial [Mesorhizobium sp.]
MGVYYALLLLVIVLSIVMMYLGRANYLSMINVSNVMYQASLTAIMAVAMTVILISGNFDLSVASVAALAAVILVGNADAIGFWPAAGLAMLVAVAAGLLNGAIVQFVGINAFIVTLGTMTALRGLVLIYTDGRSLSVDSPEALDALKAFEAGRLNVGIVVLLIGLLLLGLGAFRFIRSRGASMPVPPAAFGMLLGGLGLLALTWATGGELMLP